MTFIRQYQFGHRQFISPIPGTRPSLRTSTGETFAQRKERKEQAQ